LQSSANCDIIKAEAISSKTQHNNHRLADRGEDAKSLHLDLFWAKKGESGCRPGAEKRINKNLETGKIVPVARKAKKEREENRRAQQQDGR